MRQVREVLLVLLLTAGCSRYPGDKEDILDAQVAPARSPGAEQEASNGETEVSPEIVSKVRRIIVEQLGVDESQVQLDTDVVKDLGADSLDVVELIMAFEEEFKIEIPDEEAEKFTTVRSIAVWIANASS